jgi:O-antigen/teichoic acid export membrane protein
MGVVSRVLSGSLAAWSKVAVTALTQIALVPVFLGAWSLEEYGCWLVIQSVTAFVNIFSLAHHTYVGNEFLRVPEKKPDVIGVLLSSALPYSVALGLFELTVLGSLGWMYYGGALFDPEQRLSKELLHDAAWALALMSASIFFSVSSSALFGRVAGAFGHYPRTAWWGVAIAITTASLSALVVWRGAGLLSTAASIAALNLLVYGLYHWDMWQLVRRHGVVVSKPNWRLGWRNLVASLQLGLTYLLGLVRQQGTRILVGSTLGFSQAVAFTTMRTASNLSLQGIATVVDPMFPEFMGFLRDRKHEAVVGSFAFIWLVVMFLMGPALVMLQLFAPMLFAAWTQDKVPFDPLVFSLFSITMLVFGLARPGDSIIVGNNLMRVQLAVAAALAAFAVPGILWLDGDQGMRGVVVVLLAVEIVGACASVYFATRWLSTHGLTWPIYLFRLSLAEAALCSLALLVIALEPKWGLYTAVFSMAATACLLTFFVVQLPSSQRDWLRLRFRRYMFLGKRQ